MAVIATRTAGDIVTAALRLAGVLDVAETAEASDADEALRALDAMLKSWQNMGWNLWTKSSLSLTLTTAQSYTLSPVRPLRILSARFRVSGIESPMVEFSRTEWDELPQKSVTGRPTCFYYDRQREAALFYIWPQLATAAGETIEITFEREHEDTTDLTDTLDLPGELWEAATYALADRILDIYGIDKPKVTMRAQALLAQAAAFDREGSTYFMAERY